MTKDKDTRPLNEGCSEMVVHHDFHSLDRRYRNTFSSKLESLMNGENPYNKFVSVQELADGVGMTRQAITKYLNLGKDIPNAAVPSILVTNRIALFFGVTPNYLLDIDSEVGADAKLKFTEELLEQMGIERTTYERLCFLKSLSNENPGVFSMLNTVIRGTVNEIAK